MSPKKAFGILAGIFGCAVVLGVIGGLTVDPKTLASANRPPAASLVQPPAMSPEDLRAHHHRMEAAEQMINRVTEKLATIHKRCDQSVMKAWAPAAAENCKAAVLRAYPKLEIIRDVASEGDPVRWATAIDTVHQLEADIEKALNSSR